MTDYPLDKGNPNKKVERTKDNKVQSEAEAALRSSFELHGKTSASAANEDLTLNPLAGSHRGRTLTPDLYSSRAPFGDSNEDDSRQNKGSVIDDVVSGGTWHTSSYLGPKRSAVDDNPLEDFADDWSSSRTSARSKPTREFAGQTPWESSARPYAFALGAAGAGFFLARILNGRA